MNLCFHFVVLMFWHSVLFFLGIREGIRPSAVEQHGQFL